MTASDKCVWKWDRESETWSTNCHNAPNNNEVGKETLIINYCPYCGKEIESESKNDSEKGS